MLIATLLIERTHVQIAPPNGPPRRWRQYRFERYGTASNLQTRVSLLSGRAVNSSAVEALTPLAVKSIDVEFAHFVTKGQVVTAAAEVCLLSADGSVLLNSFISPGERAQNPLGNQVSLTPAHFTCCCRAHCRAVRPNLDRWSHS